MQKKIKVPRIAYTAPQELYAFFNENEIKVQNHIIESIKFGILNELNDVDIFELKNTFDGRNVIVLNLDKKEWIPSLQFVIDELTHDEKFEECIPLQQMIDEINKSIQIKNIEPKTNGRKIQKIK